MIPSCSVLASAPAAGGGGGGGGGTPTISITNQSVAAGGAGTQIAEYSAKTNGTITNHFGTLIENWISDATQAGNYDIMASLSSGTSPGGSALGSWLPLSSNRAWSLTNSAGDASTISCVLTVQIRLRSSGAVQDTATITISATSDEFVP